MQIHWKNPHVVPKPERDAAEAALLELAEGRTDLIDAFVDLRADAHHRHGGAEEVTLRCQARGKDLVVRKRDGDAGRALHRAVDAFRQSVRELRERRREHRPERASRPPDRGVVDRVFPRHGFGFVVTESGEEVFFRREVLQDLAIDELEEGQRVGLAHVPDEDGPRATHVSPPPPGEPR